MKKLPQPRPSILKGYRLAYFILMNQDDAIDAAEIAAHRLGDEIKKQERRLALLAEAPTVTYLEPEDLYLALVIDAADDIGQLNLKSSEIRLCPEDYICLFLLHAIRVSRRHSFPLAVTTLRIIHSYKTSVARTIYEQILYGEPRENYSWREQKGKQIAALALPFKGIARLSTGPNREDRFVTTTASESQLELACSTLEALTIWGPGHVIPEHFRAFLQPLDELYPGDLPDPNRVHPCDQRRMHALSDPECLRRLVQGVSDLTSPRKSFCFPAFALPDDPPPARKGVQERLEAPVPSERALQKIERILAVQDVLRERWSGGAVTLHVDGHRLASIRPGIRYSLRNLHASFLSTIEIWGTTDGESVMLGCGTINLIDGSADELAMEFPLTDGSTVKIQTVVRGHTESPVLSFIVVYGEITELNHIGTKDNPEMPLTVILPFVLKPPALEIEQRQLRGPPNENQ
jgi:hypothetical protein